MKEDCFAFIKANEKPGCIALRELYCKKGECPFYKVKTEAQAQPQKDRAGANRHNQRTDITRERIEIMQAKGMSIKAIAEVLNCSQTTIVRRLTNARTKWGGKRRC